MELIAHSFWILLFAALSHSLEWQGQLPIAPHHSYEVPGNNSLLFCQDPKDYILKIDHVDISPNQPKAAYLTSGTNLSIEASGYVNQEIRKNSTVLLEVRIRVGGSSVPLIKQKTDLCDELESAGRKCPIQKGNITFTQNVTLPEEIPKATYWVLADVYNDNDDKITCVETTVAF